MTSNRINYDVESWLQSQSIFEPPQDADLAGLWPSGDRSPSRTAKRVRIDTLSKQEEISDFA